MSALAETLQALANVLDESTRAGRMRAKDLDDVRALLASGQVDELEATNLLSQLETALGQSDLLPAFRAAKEDVNAS